MLAGLSVGIVLADKRRGVRWRLGQLWAGVDVGKEHHWVAVVDDTGAVALSRKLVNDEQPIRALVAEIEMLVSRCPGRWT
jgi:hypothetical protein